MTELSLRIFADTFKIAAVAYGCPKTGSRMLAYPGWLDNAGSFKTLAPELAKLGFYVVAIDPPGCGHSDHLPFGQTYNDFDEVAVVLEVRFANSRIPKLLLKISLFVDQVADCLGWSDAFHCMAHSRGGGICAAAVGSFPARFKSLIGLDTFLSLTTGRWLSASQPDSAVDAPTLMRLGHEMERRNRVRESRKFASFDEAGFIIIIIINPDFSIENNRPI
jgi:pimeloyl-ACP methyl ester carboxylesterase